MRYLTLALLAGLVAPTSSRAGTHLESTSPPFLMMGFLGGKHLLERSREPSSGPMMQILKKKLSDEDLVGELYQWSLARKPTDAELKVSLEFLKSYGPDRAAAAQDLMWALQNRRELRMM